MLTFLDDTSVLSLKNSTLDAQSKGLQLTKGQIIIDEIVNLKAKIDTYITTTVIEGVDYFEEPMTVTLTTTYYISDGIIFGNGEIYNDVKAGAKLIIKEGILVYKNIELGSMNTAQYSNIKIGENAELDLYENMDIGNAVMVFAPDSTLRTATSKGVIGSMHFEGNIYKKPLKD